MTTAAPAPPAKDLDAALLRAISLGFAHADTLEQALALVLGEVCAYGGWPLGQAWLPAEDDATLRCCDGWHGASPELRVFHDASLHTTLGRGEGLPGRALAASRAVQWSELDTDPRFREREAARCAGLRSGFAVPASVGAHAVVVLEFLSPGRAAPTPATLDALDRANDLIASLVARAREHETLLATARANAAAFDTTRRALDAFSYSVSHDLRAPLRSIDGFAQALLDEYTPQLDEHGREYLRRLRGASQRIGGVLDDLVALANLARRELRPQPVDLTAMAREIAAGLRRTAPERRATFVVQEDLTARADPDLVRTLLTELLGNAWKFTAHHASARIELGALRRVGGTVYFVRDDGAGFDMVYAGMLFRPFQRLHPASEFDGRGVGLHAVQRIAERHGGHVWAEGAVEQGATFYFTL